MRRAFGHGGVDELVDVVEAGDNVVIIMRPPGSGDEAPRSGSNVTTSREWHGAAPSRLMIHIAM